MSQLNNSTREQIKVELLDNMDQLILSDLIALNLIVLERIGQRNREGWTEVHDSHHKEGVLAMAGAVYAKIAADEVQGVTVRKPSWWPWSTAWFKPKGFQRNLERSGALILAELSRFVRE